MQSDGKTQMLQKDENCGGVQYILNYVDGKAKQRKCVERNLIFRREMEWNQDKQGVREYKS
jgi:hypothetical protein